MFTLSLDAMQMPAMASMSTAPPRMPNVKLDTSVGSTSQGMTAARKYEANDATNEMAHTTAMLLKPPPAACFGRSAGNEHVPSRRASTSSPPEASGKSATNAVAATGGRSRVVPTHASSVKPNTVPMCLMEKFAFTQA